LSKAEDLTGQKFNRLTVIKRVDKPETRKNRGVYWLCKCDCGNERLPIASTGELKSNNTKSCGCLNIERIIERNKINKKKYNTYNLTGEYGIGYTDRGKEFYFDLEDYNKIKDYCWHIDGKGYVINSKNKNEKICFHRLVTDCEDDKIVDHKNGHKTRNDNRKNNLRKCDYLENAWNRKISINNTSGCTGVDYIKNQNKWRTSIVVNKEQINIGVFNTIDEAIEARGLAEDKYYGEFRYKKEIENA